METLPELCHADRSPSSLVSGTRVGLLTGLASGGLLTLVTGNLVAGLATLAVAFVVGSVAGPLISFASRCQSRCSAVPITFSAMGTLGGVLLLPMLAAAIQPDLGLTCYTGVPFLVLWGTPFWLLLGGPLGALLGMAAGMATERWPRDPADPLAGPLQVASRMALASTLSLGLLTWTRLGSSLQVLAWDHLGEPAGWATLFLTAAIRDLGPLTLGLLVGLATFGGSLLLATREEWDRRRLRPFLAPVPQLASFGDPS